MEIDYIKIPKEKDKRRKLTDEDKREIKDLFFHKNWGIRKIARKFEDKCSRRLIQFVLYPKRLEKLHKIAKEEKRHLKYYNREKHNKAMANLRKRKKELFN